MNACKTNTFRELQNIYSGQIVSMTRRDFKLRCFLSGYYLTVKRKTKLKKKQKKGDRKSKLTKLKRIVYQMD